MPRSSKEMIDLYRSLGYEIVKKGGKGSHTKLKKAGTRGQTIPHCKELKKGLEAALMKRYEEERKEFEG